MTAMLTNCAKPLRRGHGWRGAGLFGLRLEHAITLPFRPLKGKLGLFKVELNRKELVAIRPWLAAFEEKGAYP